MSRTLGEVAALIHKDMCEDERNGYDWGTRWGGDHPDGNKTLVIDGKKYTYKLGSRDCSSSFIEAWRLALLHTKHKGKLDAATYTGNISQVFEASGLFERKPISFIASPGDGYLNDSSHVAMCQTQEPDVLSEFCWGDVGAYGNKVGDQSGGESRLAPYYDYPWDCVIHYNGKADSADAKPAAAKASAAKASAKVSGSKRRLNGIDVSSWQEGIDLAGVEADFVIVKVSGGSAAHGYVNPLWREHAEAALGADKLLGLYHFAGEYGERRTGKTEAEFFLEQAGDYAGRAVMCLDWEATAASDFPASYAKAWLDAVAAATGSTPMFYGYAGNVNSRDYSSIAVDYPLWMASYLDRYNGGTGYVDDPANTWGTGAWPAMTCYQYSSTRRIAGYPGRLDANVFYGTAADWAALAGGAAPAAADKVAAARACKNDVPWRVSADAAGAKWSARFAQGAKSGKALRWLALKGFRYRVFTQAGGWLPWVSACDIRDLERGCAGDGSPILGVQVKSRKLRYAVRTAGGWYPDMVGTRDTGGSADKFAGDLASPVLGFFCERA